MINEGREFITLLGGAAAAWPLTARAQQQAKLPTIGFSGTTRRGPGGAVGLPPFVQWLRELGWIEGRDHNHRISMGEGRYERYAEIAAEFVRLKVDVIVTGACPRSLRPSRRHRLFRSSCARRATQSATVSSRALRGRVGTSPDCRSRTPILSASGSNSCARSCRSLYSIGDHRQCRQSHAIVLEMGEVQATARSLGFEVAHVEIGQPEELDSAFEAALKGRADGLLCLSDPLS